MPQFFLNAWWFFVYTTKLRETQWCKCPTSVSQELTIIVTMQLDEGVLRRWSRNGSPRERSSNKFHKRLLLCTSPLGVPQERSSVSQCARRLCGSHGGKEKEFSSCSLMSQFCLHWKPRATIKSKPSLHTSCFCFDSSLHACCAELSTLGM